MSTLVLEISPQLRARLKERAAHAHKAIDKIAQQILEEALNVPPIQTLAHPPPPADALNLAEREARFIQQLRDEGKVVSLSPELQKLIVPNVDREQVYQEMSKVGGATLSEIVHAHRQERHDILVYGHKRDGETIRAREGKRTYKTNRRRKRK